MLQDQIIIVLFLASVVSGLLMNMLDLIGTSLYDLLQIKKQQHYLRHPFAKQFRHRPLVSIIIPAHNEEAVIERCLRSILQSSYRKFEVIVVDDASTDATKKVVAAFIAAHPKRALRLLSKRQNVGRGGAINAGYNRYSGGELIMALDADCTLERNALKQVVQHFALEDISALAANVRIMDHLSVIGLLQQFEWLASFRSKKFNTLSNSEYIVGGSGAVYKREVFAKLKGFNEKMLTEDIALSLSIAKLGNKKFLLRYASDVIVHTEPVTTYKGLFQQRYRWKLGSLQALFAHKSLIFTSDRRQTKFLSWFRLPLVVWGELMLLLEPFLIVYFLYIAISFRQPTLYAISWLAVSFLLAYAVWADEHLSLRKKLRLLFFLPIMYNLLIIMTVIQIGAMMKCVWNFKKVIGRTVIRGSWQPPKRIAA